MQKQSIYTHICLCLLPKIMAERALAEKMLKLVHKSCKAETVNITRSPASSFIRSPGLPQVRNKAVEALLVKPQSLFVFNSV